MNGSPPVYRAMCIVKNCVDDLRNIKAHLDIINAEDYENPMIDWSAGNGKQIECAIQWLEQRLAECFGALALQQDMSTMVGEIEDPRDRG